MVRQEPAGFFQGLLESRERHSDLEHKEGVPFPNGLGKGLKQRPSMIRVPFDPMRELCPAQVPLLALGIFEGR